MLLLSVLVATWLQLPSLVLAEHPAIERAIAYAERADFAAALAAFEEAESSPNLERADLLSLYAHRATVQFALGQTAAMQADLRRLVALDERASLPASAPPPLVEALDAMRDTVTPIAIDAEVHRASRGAEIRARGPMRSEDLVRRMRAWGRPAGGEWTFGDSGVLTIDAPSSSTVLWYVEALGPGDVIVATHGTREEPWSYFVPESSMAEHAGDDSLMHWLIGGGTAAAVLGAVVTGVVLGFTSSTSTTTLGGPTFVP